MPAHRHEPCPCQSRSLKQQLPTLVASAAFRAAAEFIVWTIKQALNV